MVCPATLPDALCAGFTAVVAAALAALVRKGRDELGTEVSTTGFVVVDPAEIACETTPLTIPAASRRARIGARQGARQ